MATLPSGTEIEFGWNRSRGVIVSEDYRKARYFMSTGIYVAFNDPSIKVVGKDVEGYVTVDREKGEESWVSPGGAAEPKTEPKEVIQGIVLEFSGALLIQHCLVRSKFWGSPCASSEHLAKSAFFRTVSVGLVRDATYRLSLNDITRLELSKCLPEILYPESPSSTSAKPY